MPRISVIIPVYNSQEYILETIESIQKQTFEDFEIIIVDDGSKDNTIDIVRKIRDKRIKLFYNDKNYGIAYTRNKAIERCSGEYIAIMDHDDLAPEYRLEHSCNYLDRNGDIIAVGGHCRFIDRFGCDLKKQWNVYLNTNYIKAYILFDDPLPNSSAMIRKSFLKEYDIKYRDNMFGVEDYFFWAECSLHGNISNLDEVLLYLRTGHRSATEKFRIENQVQRDKAIQKVRSFLLQSYGIVLNKQENNILNKAFREYGTVENISEIEDLYNILYSIAKQAEQLRLPHSEEIKIMCRKRFGEKIGKALFLWNH